MVKKKSWKKEAEFLVRKNQELEDKIKEMNSNVSNNKQEQVKKPDVAVETSKPAPVILKKKEPDTPINQQEQKSETSAKVTSEPAPVDDKPSEEKENVLEIKEESEKEADDYKYACVCGAYFDDLDNGCCPRCKAELNIIEAE